LFARALAIAKIMIGTDQTVIQLLA
jgi:hypothetical protein